MCAGLPDRLLSVEDDGILSEYLPEKSVFSRYWVQNRQKIAQILIRELCLVDRKYPDLI